MKTRHKRYVASKWIKHKVLSNEPLLQQYLPDTALFDKIAFQDFLNRYDTIYAKPVKGAGGRGIYKIVKDGDYRELIRPQGYKTLKFRTVKYLYRKLKEETGSVPYLIQQGIPLLTLEDRPLDFRVLMMRPGRVWRTMGVIGKVAPDADSVVTNRTRGGQPVTLSAVMKACRELDDEESQETRAELEQIGMLVAETLHRRFPGLRTVGLDVAMEEDGKLWILEANTDPGIQLFRHHEDTELFRKIRTIKRYIDQPIRTAVR